MYQQVSIIIPMLNEADELPSLIEHLLPYLQRGFEIIFVDGGSEDQSVELVLQAGMSVVESIPGRALQMNAGAAVASGDILVFLHADSRLPVGSDQIIKISLQSDQYKWGRFDVDIQGRSRLLDVVSFMMNLRSRLTGIATGDQTIFIKRSLFDQVGGFPDQPLMEDIEISRRLKRVCRPVCLNDKVTTSGRRWESRGIWRTILLMWKLRLAYWLGISAERLARVYQ